MRIDRLVCFGITLLLMGCGLGSFDVNGVVIGSEPVAGATVQVWNLDRDGTRWDFNTETETDDAGHFVVHLDIEDLPVVVTASAGTTFEYWAPEGYEMDGENEKSKHHYEAVLSRFDGGERPFVVSPVTTMVKALADQRFAEGMDARYRDSMRQARELIGGHFDFDINATIPDRAPGASMTTDIRYGLVLVGLSDIARDMVERSGSTSVQSMNTGVITKLLVEDARGPGAVFDGIGPDGEPVVFDECMPVCTLSGDTLRTELARNLSAGYLRSPQNVTGLDYSDVSEWLRSLIEHGVGDMFASASTVPLDEGSPVIQVLPSPVADERWDNITFDANFTPIHEHSTATTDLAQGFDGAGCPVVYKHVDTMWDATDNPIRVRFAVLDDVVGVSEKTINIVVQVEGAPESFAVPARAAGWGASGVEEYEATITRADAPRLADTEGRFLIDVQARDWLGHESLLMRGCWEHKPLPAQPWVSEPRVAIGADSLQSVGLEPNNNLAPVLNGTDPGKGVMEFDVRNGTDDAVYVTLDFSQPVASYSKSWIETNVYLYTTTIPDDTCLIAPVTCPGGFSPDQMTNSYVDVRDNITELIDGVRVWDITSGSAFEISPCEGCNVNEYRLESRRGTAEPRVYRVMLVSSSLDELAPREAGEPTFVIEDTPIHLLYEPTEITGKLFQTIQTCVRPSGTRCLERRVYQRYRAMTDATIIANFITVTGQARAANGLSRYVPGGQPNTLGMPLRLNGLQWSIVEGALPLPVP